MATEMNVEAERAAFEAWLGRPMMSPEQPTHYNGRDVRTAWEAWQERGRRAAQPADVGAGELPQAAQGVKTWQDRIFAVHPRSEEQYWPHDLMCKYMVQEIADLRAQLASAQQAKEYEQRHAAESEKALAQAHAQLARQSQGGPVAWMVARELFISHDAIPPRLMPPLGNPVPLYAAPPLSSEPQAEKGDT